MVISTEIILIVLLVSGLWYWYDSLRARETAYQAVRTYCRKAGLQMLDDYVALTGFWLKRNEQGKSQFWRSYAFEFTATGEDRYQGKIIMLGLVIESIQLEPYRFD